MIVLLGWLAAIVGCCISIPQLLRIVRTRNLSGISVTTWQLTLGINLAWTAHGVIADLTNMWLPNAILALWTLLILRTFHTVAGVDWFRLLGPGVGIGVLASAIDLTVGPVGFAIAAAVPSIVSLLTQLSSLVRSSDITGASPAFYVVNVTNQGIWLVWAVLTAEHAVMISGAMAGALWVISVVWLALRRARLVGPLGQPALVDPTVQLPMPLLELPPTPELPLVEQIVDHLPSVADLTGTDQPSAEGTDLPMVDETAAA
ncbi:MAG TPA: hypothetical protein IAA98_16020 [Candidatus Avipropionibacterium avicola]|uniref:PQ loop repeat protein n=1 Tax=Candidatus Avipropionibacterium avicola TaxID=2840701 RepID=A0A9D1KP18_9ACTN|nr:hypothetical protein [Candidatus Avipropionibacterium avicola]